MTLAAVSAAFAAKTAVDLEYRLAVVAAVGEHGAARVAVELGVSRQAVYQLVRRAVVEAPADPLDELYDDEGHLRV